MEKFRKENSETHLIRPKISYEIVNEIIFRIKNDQLAEWNEFQVK